MTTLHNTLHGRSRSRCGNHQAEKDTYENLMINRAARVFAGREEKEDKSY